MEQTLFEQKYLAQLSPQQREAVLAVNGPVLLLAVPGSGKTTVLVTRLGYMVHCCGIDPRSILTMTYTIAATKDMKNRYAAFFGEEAASALSFRTINGVSAVIIDYFSRRHAGRAPFELQTDEGELIRIIRSIYQELNERYAEDGEVKEIRRLITYIKNMMLSDEEIQKLDTEIEGLPELYRRYRETLRGRRLMDYDDQMAYAYNILQKYPEVLESFQDRYRYICVDEAQDTSKIQHAIIRLLASKSENLFMVGDEDQSIYGFRAAYPDALLSFERDHPNARILLMEENYRSTAEIIAAANRFVGENRFRHPKSMIPVKGSGTPVHVIRAKSRAYQFEYLLRAAEKSTEETAILFRNNDSALPLIDMLEKNGIHYNCRNVDDLFFTHRVVIDVLDILRFSYEPRDEELFLRLYYKFGAPISRKSALYAIERSRVTKKPLLEELAHAPELHGAARDAVFELMQNLPQLQQDSAETALHRIWEAMHYGRYVEQRKLDKGKYFILGMLSKGLESPRAFLEKLQALKSMLAEHRNSADNRILLSTIHSSKGLEYDSVYLTDVIDGVLPSKTKNEAGDMDEIRLYEEERRLYYVGMTRAKNDLYLFSCPGASSFTAEVTKSLPTPVIDTDDVFAPLLLPRLGKRYHDQRWGRGEIVAESVETNLIAFSDGHCELLSLEEMMARKSVETVFAVQEEKPAAAAAALWNKAAADPLAARLFVGGLVLHRSFGTGSIISIKDDILTVDFGEKGVRKLGLSLSLQNHLLSAL